MGLSRSRLGSKSNVKYLDFAHECLVYIPVFCAKGILLWSLPHKNCIVLFDVFFIVRVERSSWSNCSH